ncbi:DUF2269 family protein [Gorillibacterium sp. sgz5001074]|uniref:DUF2269 family protein n=1 Tax=Gorillibacterium sp. sgz5001074 TaxID=3446695 RepID=UPI003F6616DB
MSFLVLLHAMAAVLGVGPTFFIHTIFRRQQNVGQLRHSLGFAQKLELFPKIGGSLAVLTGIVLVIVSDWSFKQLWITASLALYVLIQIVAVGLAAPKVKQLIGWVRETKLADSQALPSEQSALVARTNSLYWLTTVMGATLFMLMFYKPM